MKTKENCLAARSINVQQAITEGRKLTNVPCYALSALDAMEDFADEKLMQARVIVAKATNGMAIGVELDKALYNLLSTSTYRVSEKVETSISWENSSTVARTTYREVGQELIVEFKNGQRYSYSDFPRSAWEELITTESIGSFIHKKIKGNYTVIQLKPI